MIARRLSYLLFVVAFGLGMAPNHALAAASPLTTAKTLLPQATAAAKARRADAVLTQLDSGNVDANGMAYWRYVYFSRSAPAATNCLLVRAFSGRPVLSIEELAGCEQNPVAEDFIDTDRVNTIARANGITKARTTMHLSSSPSPGGTTWAVYDEGGTALGNVLLDIDAKTGQLLHKTSQR